MGHCNCGHLAQTVTALPAAKLHALALEKYGEWADKAHAFCEHSGYPIDHVLSQMLKLGLTTQDIAYLERLSGPKVLAAIPGRSYLNYRERDDVVLYLRTWASQLEGQFLQQQHLPEALTTPEKQLA